MNIFHLYYENVVRFECIFGNGSERFLKERVAIVVFLYIFNMNLKKKKRFYRITQNIDETMYTYVQNYYSNLSKIVETLRHTPVDYSVRRLLC